MPTGARKPASGWYLSAIAVLFCGVAGCSGEEEVLKAEEPTQPAEQLAVDAYLKSQQVGDYRIVRWWGPQQLVRRQKHDLQSLPRRIEFAKHNHPNDVKALEKELAVVKAGPDVGVRLRFRVPGEAGSKVVHDQVFRIRAGKVVEARTFGEPDSPGRASDLFDEDDLFQE